VVQQESSPLLMLIVGFGLLLAGMSFLDNRPPQSTSGPPQSTSGPPKPASTSGPPQNVQPAGTGGPPNVKPAGTGGPPNLQTAGPQNLQPAGPQNVQPAGPQNMQPAGTRGASYSSTSGPQTIDGTAVSDRGSNGPPSSNLDFARRDNQSDLRTSIDQEADHQFNVAPGSYTTDAPTRRNPAERTTAAWTPSPTDLGSQSVQPPSEPDTVLRSCPDACKISGKICREYKDAYGTCGGDDSDFGMNAGYLERNQAKMTDCTMCTAPTAQYFPSDYYCEDDVCVKPPPNCFGAKYDVHDCFTCEDAKKAAKERNWQWLGHLPDTALFCRKWQ
jgi:hypothetical protein